jgi:hypothetical protein
MYRLHRLKGQTVIKTLTAFCLVHQDVLLIVPEDNLPYQKLYLLAAQHKHTFNQNDIDIDIFVNCNWVDTRWQYTFTHKQYIEHHN